MNFCITFVVTVLATLPTPIAIGAASQGESYTPINTPSLPLNDAHLEGFFKITEPVVLPVRSADGSFYF